MYFLKTRYYDPEIGRFMTIDGIAYLNPDSINGLNLYAYCGNNPIMRVDYVGESWIALGVISALVNVVITFTAAKVTNQEYTWVDAGVAAIAGFSNSLPGVGPLISGAVSGIYAGVVAYSNGASAGDAILAGAASAAATILSIGNLANSLGPVLDIGTSIVVDLVFGTAYNSLAAAISKSIIEKSRP